LETIDDVKELQIAKVSVTGSLLSPSEAFLLQMTVQAAAVAKEAH
jgi:hypothetical protein